MHQSKNTGPIRRIYSEAIVKAKNSANKNLLKVTNRNNRKDVKYAQS